MKDRILIDTSAWIESFKKTGNKSLQQLRSKNWKILDDRDADTLLRAIDITFEYRIHLWDALIAACMKENDVVEIVTENKVDFERITERNHSLMPNLPWCYL